MESSEGTCSRGEGSSLSSSRSSEEEVEEVEEDVEELLEVRGSGFTSSKILPEPLPMQAVRSRRTVRKGFMNAIVPDTLRITMRIEDFFLAVEKVPSIEFGMVFFFYLTIVATVVVVERTVRLHLFIHIPYRPVRYAFTKIFMAIVYLALFFWLMQEIVFRYPNVLAALAFVGAALIVCMQDVIKGFFGWLMQMQSLSLGNRVTMGSEEGPITGDVVDVGILYPSLLVVRTPDLKNISQVGKIIRVPNSSLITHPVINYNSTSDFLRVELPVVLADETQYDAAKEIFGRVLQEKTDIYHTAAKKQIDRRTRRFFFPQEFHDSMVLAEISREGVRFTLTFVVPMRRRRMIVTDVTEAILAQCKAQGIRIVFAEGE